MRALGIIALDLMLLIGGAMLLMSDAKSEASLDQAFDGAIKAINEERGKNRANEFGCTQFFSEFYLAKKIEPYVVFLGPRSSGNHIGCKSTAFRHVRNTVHTTKNLGL
jgi:hypothetical protein